MNNKLITRCLYTLCITVFCLLLSACDGGIFGTGDGGSSDAGALINGVSAADSDSADSDNSDANVDADNSDETPSLASPADNTDGADDSNPNENQGASAPAATPQESSPDPQGNANTTDNFVAANDAVASQNGEMVFNNSIVVNDDSTEFAFANETDMSIGLFSSPDSNAVSLLTLEPNAIGFSIFSPSIDALYIDQVTNDGNRLNRIVINSLTVAQGSKSLFVLGGSDAGLRLLAMPSYNDAENNNGSFPRRIISTALVGDPEISSTFMLTPDPSVAGSGGLPTILFNPITAQLPVTDYRNIPVGEYLLSDDSGRFPDAGIRISVRANETIRTTLLNPNRSGVNIGIDF